jgi:hypothetical protein
MSEIETKMWYGQIWTKMISKSGIMINKNNAKDVTMDPVKLHLKMAISSMIRMT